MAAEKARCLFREMTSIRHLVSVLTGLTWHGSPGIIRICPGIAQSCGLGSLKRMAQSYKRSALQEALVSLSSSRSGLRLAAYTLCPIEWAGGRSTVGRMVAF